jgi:hypothetical protein
MGGDHLWEAFGAIGEVVGAVAVVVTLLFLVTQLRQNTKSLDASRRANISQLYQFRAQMHMDGMLKKVESSEICFLDVMARIQAEGAESLSDRERMFLIMHSTADAVRLDNGLFQYRNGYLDDDYFSYIERSIRGLAPLWHALGLFQFIPFRQGFIDEVDRICGAEAD